MRRLLVLLLVATPALAFAAPPEGVPLKIRRGLFTETDLGAFATFGGLDRYANAQGYLQLGVGYDVSRSLELGLSFGLGTSASDCFATRDPQTGACTQADSFTMTLFDLTATYLVPVAERLYLTPAASVGYSYLDPAPRVSNAGTPLRSGLNLGAGVGIEYATAMDHFSIGASLLFRYVLGPDIPTLALFPRVKYTF